MYVYVYVCTHVDLFLVGAPWGKSVSHLVRITVTIVRPISTPPVSTVLLDATACHARVFPNFPPTPLRILTDSFWFWGGVGVAGIKKNPGY